MEDFVLLTILTDTSEISVNFPFSQTDRSILSGPAGGVVGYAMTTWDPEKPQPVIGFDMVKIIFSFWNFLGIFQGRDLD